MSRQSRIAVAVLTVVAAVSVNLAVWPVRLRAAHQGDLEVMGLGQEVNRSYCQSGSMGCWQCKPTVGGSFDCTIGWTFGRCSDSIKGYTGKCWQELDSTDCGKRTDYSDMACKVRLNNQPGGPGCGVVKKPHCYDL
jgi:hypothetical protein